MKTRNDDFSRESYPEENNVQATFAFKALDGKYYKAELDISPSSFINVVAKHCIRKPFPWAEFVRFTEEEQAKQPANSRRKGTYKPAPNVNGIIASLIEEKVTA